MEMWLTVSLLCVGACACVSSSDGIRRGKER